MHPFLEQLAAMCEAFPTRAKWVFVPTHGQGRTLGERLVRDGTNWLNLRFVTPLDIALRMGAPFLVERGIEPSEEELGPALMMRLLLDQPPAEGYFRPLAGHPTLAQVLWSTVRELRMAGVGPDDIPPDVCASPGKHRELCALLRAYERHLAATRRADMARVYEEAVRHPDWCPIQTPDCWTVVPDVVWAPRQEELFRVLPGERIVPRALALPGVIRPRRRTADVDRVAADPRTSPLAFLLASADAEGSDGRLEIFHAGGRDAEIEEVFRRILAAGHALDAAEVACATDEGVLFAWEKALRYGWPVTVGTGVPVAQTRPGRALLGWCAWIEGDFPSGVLRRLLQSGDMVLPLDTVSRGQAAAFLARAGAGWGRATYGRALRRLHGRYVQKADDPDNEVADREAAARRAAQLDALRVWIEAAIASVPEPDADEEVELTAVVQAATAFLEASAARISALDAAAGTALLGAVRELLGLGAFRCSLPAALRFVRQRVEGVVVAPDRPRPGHLHVSRLTEVGIAGRPAVFLTGLEEGRVFPARVEDPVLLDAERAALHAALVRSSDRIDEHVAAVLARVAACGAGPQGRVTFSYSSRDTREYRETFPSWLVLQAFRLRSGNPDASYSDLRAALGVACSPVPAQPGAALSDSGWWLTLMRATGPRAAAAVRAAFPALDAGIRADDARESDRFTEFDGHVPAAGALLDPARADQVTSATQLENAAGCPFRHFLERGLGVRALEDGERDLDVWLDPLTRGAELHDLYAALLRRGRDAGRPPDPGQDGEWLRSSALARLDVLCGEMPPPSREVFMRERDELLQDLDLFLEEEHRCAIDRTAVGLEVSFGRGKEDEGESLARDEPVIVPIGGGLALRLAGRIDRIDEVGRARFEIVDYKTGSFWEDSWQGTFAGGTRLQHALYGLAAVELLKRRYRRPSVDAGVYYFSSARGRQERVRIPRPATAAVEAVLSDLREVLASGRFVHAPDAETCRWCDYGDACGPRAHERAKQKLGDPALAAFVRLQAHT